MAVFPRVPGQNIVVAGVCGIGVSSPHSRQETENRGEGRGQNSPKDPVILFS